MNRYPLLSKLLMIGLLMALLAVPLAMVRGTVAERAAYRDAATDSVARAHAGEQVITGPVVWWPYTETHVRSVKAEGDGARLREETVTEQRVAVRYLQQLDLRSRLDSETRWRGIFPVTVYTSRHEGSGRLAGAGIVPSRPGAVVTPGQPLLLLGVSDLRGLEQAPLLRLGGRSVRVAPAPAGAPLPLAAPLDAALLQPGAQLELHLQLALAGTGRIGWVPLADETRVTLASAWPHPRFDGDFLPRTRRVSAEGFEATWQVTALSSAAQTRFAARDDKPPVLEQFGVSLADPVDAYRLADRATKYGLLFVVLTFAAFFVLEMVRRWRIHPLQYGMVGAALVLFFLLLLALAEQLPFAAAYAGASAACITLLGYYLRHALRGWRPGLAVSGLLVALYGVLYGILMSEDNALLMGALLLFGVQAAVMVATRRIDWYRVMPAAEPAAGADATGEPGAAPGSA